MASIDTSPDEESRIVSEATAFLAARNISATARDFRLRQEFYRFGWDIRVRQEAEGWIVHALKPERPEVLIQASSEGNALRIALMHALRADNPESS